MNLFIVFIAAFIGSGLKAIGGFGFATLAMPALSLFWDVPTAIAVVSIPTMLTSVMNGERAVIEILHGEIDPIQEAAVEVAARLAIQEVNDTVLAAIASDSA